MTTNEEKRSSSPKERNGIEFRLPDTKLKQVKRKTNIQFGTSTENIPRNFFFLEKKKDV